MLKNKLNKILIIGITAFLPTITSAEIVKLFGEQICANDPCKLSDVLTAIEVFINFLAVDVAVPLAVLAIAVSGFRMIVYSNNSGEVSSAKKIITNALYGVFLAFAAYLVIKAIVFGLTGGATPEDIINRGLNKTVN